MLDLFNLRLVTRVWSKKTLLCYVFNQDSAYNNLTWANRVKRLLTEEDKLSWSEFDQALGLNSDSTVVKNRILREEKMQEWFEKIKAADLNSQINMERFRQTNRYFSAINRDPDFHVPTFELIKKQPFLSKGLTLLIKCQTGDFRAQRRYAYEQIIDSKYETGCLCCKDEDITESIQHYITECRNWRAQRMIVFGSQYITSPSLIDQINYILNLKSDENRHNIGVQYQRPLIQINITTNSVSHLLRTVIKTPTKHQIYAKVALFLQLTHRKRIQIILNPNNLTPKTRTRRSDSTGKSSSNNPPTNSNRTIQVLAYTSSQDQKSQAKRTAMETWLNPNL